MATAAAYRTLLDLGGGGRRVNGGGDLAAVLLAVGLGLGLGFGLALAGGGDATTGVALLQALPKDFIQQSSLSVNALPP